MAHVISIPYVGLQSAEEDKALASLDADVALGIKEILEKEQKERRIAEYRKSKGLDGTCDDCGELIGEKRLEAKPFAVRCWACQRLKEEAEGLNRPYPQRAF